MTICRTLILASLMLITTPLRAEQPATVRSLAANCTSCHGPSGNSAGAIPSIAGLDRATIVLALQEYKAGKRPATVMHQHAKGYTDQEFELLADYFSAQQRK